MNSINEDCVTQENVLDTMCLSCVTQVRQELTPDTEYYEVTRYLASGNPLKNHLGIFWSKYLNGIGTTELWLGCCFSRLAFVLLDAPGIVRHLVFLREHLKLLRIN